jgi:hypothetical protein
MIIFKVATFAVIILFFLVWATSRFIWDLTIYDGTELSAIDGSYAGKESPGAVVAPGSNITYLYGKNLSADDYPAEFGGARLSP